MDSHLDSIKSSSLAVPPDFGLAPMEGVSELAFRLWIAQTSSPVFCSTPFLRATDSYPAEIPRDFAPETAPRLELLPYSVIVQVMASRPQDFVRTARLFLLDHEFVDLNCGCPSPSPVHGGAGSSLLREPLHFRDFTQHLSDSLPSQSFSIKMRSGFTDTQYFSQYLQILAALPLRQLTIHGRTRTDRYDHQSRWDLIHSAALALPFSVVGSGDVLSWATWQRLAATAPSIKRVIVGRGALRNPWIFAELRSGQHQHIRRSVLQRALACFALLTELGLNRESFPLLRLIDAGLWQKSAGTDPDAWQGLYDRLCFEVYGQPCKLSELQLQRISLGRLKMIWNSLRSSLPSEYFSPLLLRSRSVGELVAGLQSLDPGDELFAIRHNPDYDWLYTSSRIKQITI